MIKLLAAISLLLATTVAMAAELHVDDSGLAGNPCTAGAPCTVATALGKAKAGDSVLFGDGSYGALQTTANGVTYRAANKWAAKIVSSGGDFAWDNRGSDVTIQGFDVSGQSRIGLYNGGSRVRMVENHVHDLTDGACKSSGGAGIMSDYWLKATDVTIARNLVYRIGPASYCNFIQGIYVQHPGTKVLSNIVHNASGVGIASWHDGRQIDISGNTVFSNKGGGILIGAGDGPCFDQCVANDFRVTNNILVGNGFWGIDEQGRTGSNNLVANNLIWENQLVLDPGHTAQNTVTAEPQFVRWQADGNGDYHLAQGSPAIDAGTAMAAPAVDYDGQQRPMGTSQDIGAVEYVATTTVPIPEPPPVAVAGDTSPPTAPTGLRTIAGSDWIEISWRAARDNVGVASYAISRNGVVIGMTMAAAAYKDFGLQRRTGYTYRVAATDAQGNSSSSTTTRVRTK